MNYVGSGESSHYIVEIGPHYLKSLLCVVRVAFAHLRENRVKQIAPSGPECSCATQPKEKSNFPRLL